MYIYTLFLVRHCNCFLLIQITCLAVVLFDPLLCHLSHIIGQAVGKSKAMDLFVSCVEEGASQEDVHLDRYAQRKIIESEQYLFTTKELNQS